MRNTSNINMNQVDNMVFMPQIAAMTILCMTGIINIMAPIQDIILPLFGTIAIVSFVSGIVLIPAKIKQIPPIYFCIGVFCATLAVATLIATHITPKSHPAKL